VLVKKNLIDEDIQNFVLQAILQNRLGIHYVLIRMLNLIPMSLANTQEQALITIPSQSIHTEGCLLRLEFDSYYHVVTLSYTSAITYGADCQIKIGEARMVLKITRDLTVKLESLDALIDPINKINCEKGTKLQRELEDALNHLFFGLHELSLKNPTPPIQQRPRVSIAFLITN